MTIFVMRSIFVLLGLLTFAFIWASFKSARKTSPLEITFDPRNPSKRFWSMESIVNSEGGFIPLLEYRIEIKNNSLRTVRNVSVTKVHTGQMPQMPVNLIFDKTKKTSCDIKPRCSELAIIQRWPIKILPGMLSGLSALEYGPIKVIANGDDVLPATRVFQFDYQREPMIFD